jgi:hypothetical protein
MMGTDAKRWCAELTCGDWVMSRCVASHGLLDNLVCGEVDSVRGSCWYTVRSCPSYRCHNVRSAHTCSNDNAGQSSP